MFWNPFLLQDLIDKSIIICRDNTLYIEAD